jgi:hypothetical protein
VTDPQNYPHEQPDVIKSNWTPADADPSATERKEKAAGFRRTALDLKVVANQGFEPRTKGL